MTAAKTLNLISVEDYLAGELVSPVKHEYLGGIVHAMAGGRNVRNRIGVNLVGTLHFQLRGRKCEAFNSDTKIRIRLPTQSRFYYPDASIVCRPNPPSESFQDEAVVIFEVLSKRTRRIDEGEKKESYLTIPSLAAYVLIEQEFPAAVVFRRTEQGFVRELHEGMETVLSFPEIDVQLPFSDLYERVEIRAGRERRGRVFVRRMHARRNLRLRAARRRPQ